MEEKPQLQFSPIDGLQYDIDEIDHPMYMFSHECVGCVMLTASAELSHYGKVMLEGKEHTDWKIIRTNNFPHPLLVVYLRGYLRRYDSEAALHIEGFTGTDGREMPPQDLTIHVKPRRNRYEEKYQKHEAVALQTALESAVLLKNDGILPLTPGMCVATFGSGVANYRICPTGAGRINPRTRRSLLQAIEEASDLTYDAEIAELYAVPNDRLPDEAVLSAAAERCDAALVVLTRGTGENVDNRPVRGEYYLTEEEETLIHTVAAVFDRCIVILNVSYPIDTRFLADEHINACLYTGLGGMQATEALMQLLDGRSTPSGHLPDTWPVDYFDQPSSVNFLNFTEVAERPMQTDDPYWAQVCYEEEAYVGYRYFESFGKKVAFPFGFGLSYTTFSYEPVRFIADSEHIELTVRVQNTGTYPGKAVLQLYASKPNDRLEHPLCEMVAFGKTELLAPGQGTMLMLTARTNDLASYDEKAAAWMLLQGRYAFSFGENAAARCEIGELRFTEDQIVQQVKNRVCPQIPVHEFSREDRSVSRKDTGLFTERPFAPIRVADPAPVVPAAPEKPLYFEDVMADPDLAEAFVSQYTDEELCRSNVCLNRDWSMDAKGEAGWTVGIERLHLPSFSLADGNNGVNLIKPNIGMPTSCMVAGTFNAELAYQVGCAIAEEAVENGVSILLGPAMNLHRNIFCGRNAEYFSEDPCLAGIMAGQQNKGFQDNGVCGCIKHVAANNCEALRKRSDSVMTERTLREMYLRPFAYAMQIEPSDTIMTGYNALNGVFCDENAELIEDVFREELGFDGFAMSDWNSYDTSDIGNMVRAGISFLTPGSGDDWRVKPVRGELTTGRLSRATLVRNVARIVKTLAKRKSSVG